MITAITRVNCAKTQNKSQKTAQKSQNFGQMTYFIEGIKPVVCSQKKEASLFKRFIRSLETSLLYNQGPQNYEKDSSAIHILTNEKGSTMFMMDENYGERGKHVLDINIGHNKENTTIFVYEDKENKPLIEKLRKTIEKLRKRDGAFTLSDTTP